MNHPKLQHYVPQFILRNFCFDEQHLYCFDKQANKIFSPNVKNVASETFFNDLEDGVPETSLEGVLSRIEDRAAIGIKKAICENSIRILDQKDYKNIAIFLAFQMVRTKSAREELRHINEELGRIIKQEGQDPESVANFRIIKNEQELKEIAIDNYKVALSLYPSLIKKKWILFTSRDKFITSDNPVRNRIRLIKVRFEELWVLQITESKYICH